MTRTTESFLLYQSARPMTEQFDCAVVLSGPPRADVTELSDGSPSAAPQD